MRQLLDSGTWHQQQLTQLAAFLTPPDTVVYFTAGINSFFTGILERIKNFTIPNSFIYITKQRCIEKGKLLFLFV
jgi:hypothetical protein